MRDSRIRHKAGDIVEVSPEEAYFLTSVGSAKAVEQTAAKPEAKEPKEATKPKKETKKK